MTAEVEPRVREANLVARDEQLEQLFGEDLSHRLLGHVSALKEGRMTGTTSDKQSGAGAKVGEGRPETLPPAPPGPPSPRGPRRWVPALVAAVLVILAGAALLLLDLGESPEPPVATVPETTIADDPGPPPDEADAPEVEDPEALTAEAIALATAYLDARNAYDAQAIRDILAEDVTFSEETTNQVEELEVMLELQRSGGAQYTPFSCEPFVREGWAMCTYQVDSRFHRLAGVPPMEGEFLFGAADGKLSLVRNQFPFEEFMVVLGPWRDWLIAEHPEVLEQIFQAGGGPPILTPEAVRLHDEYLDLYEESLGSQEE